MSKKVEIKTITYEHANYDWQRGNKNCPVVSTSQKNVIDYQNFIDYRDFLTNADKKLTLINKLSPKQTVYFHSSATFPRAKFRSSYPENKIVLDINKADVVVVDTSNLGYRLRWTYGWHLVPSINIGNYTLPHSATANATNNPVQFIEGSMEHLQKIKKIIESTFMLSDKICLNVTELTISSEEDLDVEAVKRISAMLSSNDVNMINMGVNLLTAYNYTKNKHVIAVLMNTYWSNWRQNRKKANSVEVKTLLRSLTGDFPTVDAEYEAGKIQFMLQMATSYPEDEIVTAAVSQALGRYLPKPLGENQTLKIQIVSNEVEETV